MDEGVPVSVKKAVSDHLIQLFGRRQFQWPAGKLHTLSLLGMNIGGGTQGFKVNGEERLLYRFRDLFDKDRDLVFFDVGANKGTYAQLIDSVFGSRAQIHCFEPVSTVFKELQANTRSIKHATLHPYALGSSESEAEIFMTEDFSGTASLHEETFSLSGDGCDKREMVKIERLDRTCEGLRIDKIDFLKIDTEGSELEALKGCGALLANRKIGAIQFEFGQNNIVSRTFFRDFFTLFNTNGYELFRVLSNGTDPLEEYKPAYEIFVSATNFLAVSPAYAGALRTVGAIRLAGGLG